MAFVKKEVTTYEATIGSWEIHTLDGAPYEQTAAIVVETEDGSHYSLFFTNNETLPANAINEDAGIFWGFFRSESFHPMIELLREEEPMFVYYMDDDTWLRLSTAKEPVGEAELLAKS